MSINRFVRTHRSSISSIPHRLKIFPHCFILFHNLNITIIYNLLAFHKSYGIINPRYALANREIFIQVRCELSNCHGWNLSFSARPGRPGTHGICSYVHPRSRITYGFHSTIESPTPSTFMRSWSFQAPHGMTLVSVKEDLRSSYVGSAYGRSDDDWHLSVE